MSDQPQEPNGYEPTIRIEREPEPENTSTRKISYSPDGKKVSEGGNSSGITGRFLAQISGMFHRRNGTFEPVPLRSERRHVALEAAESATFPPLEKAYERTEEIGAGGQARLYRGFDLNLRRQVAVKSLREEQGQVPELREKFVLEAMITAQLDHPAIVPVYSIHRDAKNNLHLAMKLINGRPFQNYLFELSRHYERDGFFAGEEQRSLNYRLEVFLSVCDALEYAHNRNIMHCDLKPENIMIGEYHEAYLMDWGLARRIDDPEFDPATWKAPTVITGTPRFLSPEAIRGEHCDHRADIYALGLILYEVVTLHFAYDGNDNKTIIERICCGDMRPVTHRFGYPIPADLRKIILKAAAWDRDERYKSVEEFSSDLRKFIRGEEVSANPDTIFGRLARTGFRHRRLMLITTLIMVAFGAVAMSFTLYNQIKADMIEKERSEFRGRREHELGLLLDRAIGISRTFDRQIAKLGHDLSSITSEALLLLNAEGRTPAGEPVYSRSDLVQGKAPPTLAAAPGFGYEIDVDNMVYQIAPGTNPANTAERVRRLAMLRPALLRAMIECRQDSTVSHPHDVPLLRQRVINSGTPLIDIYFGFRDGLFVLYPCSKILPEDFDHRQRSWYKERVDGSHTATGALWGAPYLSVDGDVMLPCSVQMIDTKGNFHGVAAIDVSVLKLVESLRGKGDDGGYLIEKTIVDANGDVVVDSDEKFIKASSVNDGKGSRRVSYKDMSLFERIKARRNGVILRRENGGHAAYIFSGMYSVEWYYIEKINLGKFFNERGIQVPWGLSPEG